MKDKKIRNKIITISGEPVSGKGTNVDMIIEKLKKLGYTDKQIHIQRTGDEFRKYANCVVDFIKNINNPEKLKQIVHEPEIQDFFKSKEYRTALIRTIVELRDAKVDLTTFSIEQVNELEEFEGVRNVLDTLIDSRMKEKGEQINQEEHPNDIWVIDSRLAFSNIPEAFSVRLTCNSTVAGQRLFNDKKRGVEDSQYKTVEEAIEAREARKNSERKRYIKKYDVDLQDENNYDLIIDSSYSSVEDISDTILECSELFYKNKPFGKKWASPNLFLPLQREIQTYEPSTMCKMSLEDLTEQIKENGYYPESTIEIIEVDGKKYIIEGHHRNFATARAGNTLIPYETIAKDDEVIPGTQITARQRAENISLSNIYGHEDMVGNDFRYSKVYPGIYKEIQELQAETR